MKKKFLKKIILIASSCILSLGMTSSLFAEVVSSNKYATVNGRDYKFYATAGNTSGSPWARTNLVCESGSVPEGYMGVLAGLYNSNGTLIKQSSWYYNANVQFGIGVYAHGSGSGHFYSYGKVAIYNGNGYNTYYTSKSPNVAATSLASFNNIADYKLNDTGETYGSGLNEIISGELPDLIEAYGTNGALGYVRREDLQLEPAHTPKEALKQQNNRIRIIPLYDVDGKTTIGTFKIRTDNMENF